MINKRNPSIFSDTDDPIVEVKEAIKWMLGQKMDSKFEPEVRIKSSLSSSNLPHGSRFSDRFVGERALSRSSSTSSTQIIVLRS